MSAYENVLNEIGDFGPYQIRVFVLVSLMELPVAWAMLLPILVSATPNWKCSTITHIWNSTALYINGTASNNLTSMSTNFTSNECSADGSICPGMEFVDDFTTIISEWGLVCNMDYAADLITSIQMGGVMLGAVLSGQLADMFGRRYVFYTQYLLLIVFWFSSAFSQTWIAYAILRFFVGGFCGGILVISFVIPMEFITPKWRSVCGCVGLWGLGIGLLGVWGYIVRDWRHVVMGTALCSAPLLLTFWFVPESPRWLLKRGRFEEAENIISAMAKFNKKPLPDLSVLKSFVKDEHNSDEARKRFSYWHLFGTKKLIKSTLVLVYCWFAASVVYYGVQLNVASLSGDRYLNIFLMGIVEIPSLLFVVFAANKIGRRRCALGLLLIVGSSLITIMILSIAGKVEEFSTLTRTLAMIGKAGISGGWGALMLFSGETYPTIIRNIGIAACNTAARIGGIVAPQLVYLSKVSEPFPFAIFGTLAIIAGFLIFVLPETAGNPLTDGLKDQTITVNGDHHFCENGKDELKEIKLKLKEENDTHGKGFNV